MPVLLEDPETTAPSVDDPDEPLVPVPSSTADPAAAERPFVRSGVAARLSVAQLLLPPGRRLRVVEGYRRSEDRPERPPACAAHATGAAVDVTVVDRLGRPVDLGDVPGATPEEHRGACFADPVVGAAAQEERALLHRAMTGAGFVGSPTQWWHWSLAQPVR